MTAPTCTYKVDINDNLFQCDQEYLEDKDLCLFNDEKYLKDDIDHKNKDKVIAKLNDRIDKCLANNESLFCIGYHLPDIRIKGV